MDARSIAATAANKGYLTAATDLDVNYTKPKYFFDKKIYENRVFDSKGVADPGVEIQFGPNIKDWPAMSALPEHMVLKVVSEIHDPVTTTDELIPSGETSSFRSNPLGLAEFALSRKDPLYVGRAKEIQKAEKAVEAGECPVEAVPELQAVIDTIKTVYPDFGEKARKEKGYAGFGSTIFAVKPGDGSAYELPAADYKVTYKTKNTDKERGVYSFCMCPGGYVVNASSENGRTCINGMSYSGRDSRNANSAIIVTVGPDDFGHGVLDGIKFQRQLEANAYAEGNGKVPVQLFGDFEKNITTTELGEVEPCIKGEYTFANLRNVLPSYVTDSVVEGVHGFSRFIHDFDRKDAVLSGVESRTSSPVRIIRNDELVSTSVCGLYPCGEGAGYAGGITSAAVDGVKVAEYMAVTAACMG